MLYLIPKIYTGTVPVPGKPIISAINSATEKISQFIDHFVNPCTARVPSYLKDTIHFLQTLEELGPLPVDSWLVTLHVTQLYISISNRAGLAAARGALGDFRPNPLVKPSNNSLIHLMEFPL